MQLIERIKMGINNKESQVLASDNESDVKQEEEGLINELKD